MRGRSRPKRRSPKVRHRHEKTKGYCYDIEVAVAALPTAESFLMISIKHYASLLGVDLKTEPHKYPCTWGFC